MEIYNEIEKLVNTIIPFKNTGNLPINEDPVFNINDKWYLMFCRHQNSTIPVLTTNNIYAVRYSLLNSLNLLNNENILKVKLLLEEYIINKL
ncbi:MAG: hypothetical protein H7836_08160 [Magnetococcus sp. YQC-3]